MLRSILLAVLLAPASLLADVWSVERTDVDVHIQAAKSTAVVRGRAVLVLDDETSFGPTVGVNGRKPVMRIKKVSVVSPARKHEPIVTRLFEGGKPTQIAPIRFEQEFRKGDRVEIEFEVESTERSSQFVVTPEFALGSWVEIWYPIPGDAKKGFASAAAPGTTTLRIPRDWRGVAPGALVDERVEGNERVETWTTRQPAARSFAAGPLHRVEVTSGKTPVAFYVFDKSRDYTPRAELLGRAIDAMAQRFGPFPYDTWNVVEIPDDLVTWAAASEQGFIMVRTKVLGDDHGALPLFAHEAAHGWWGNRVRGSGAGGKMFSEALAQFGALMAIEALEGEEAAIEFLRFSRRGYNQIQCALGYFYIWREGGDKPLAELENAQWDHNLSDSKGHWFYWMLRHRIGDEAFFGALRKLQAEFPGKFVRIADLRAVMLEAAPADKGLPQFLDQWLLRKGAPVLSVDWWSIERGKAVELIIDQKQEGEPFAIDLAVAVDLHDGSTLTEIVSLSERRTTCRIATPSRPLNVRLDPRHRLLMWRPEYGPPP